MKSTKNDILESLVQSGDIKSYKYMSNGDGGEGNEYLEIILPSNRVLHINSDASYNHDSYDSYLTFS